MSIWGRLTDKMEANYFYQNLYSWFDGYLPESLDWLVYTLTAFVMVITVINTLVITVALYSWFERRILARFQVRIGPNRWGPFGLFQPIADLIKSLTKEDLLPVGSDKWVFRLAPVIMFVPVAMVLSVVPFGKNTFIADLNIGILFIIAVTSLNTIGIFMAGWASGNKYAMFGAMRGVAQLISYEVPMVLSIVGVILLVSSLSMVDIVNNQGIPFVLLQPLGAFVFLVAASAEMGRAPFDILEAESELVAGYQTEYSGLKYLLILQAEFSAPIVHSAVIATLFLQGWRGPILPSHLWFFLKTFLVVFLLLWVRATFPRLRVDQILGFAWKGLLPLAMINLFVIAIEVQIWPSPSTSQLWIMAGINWIVMIGSVVLISNILGQSKYKANSNVVNTELTVSVKEVE